MSNALARQDTEVACRDVQRHIRALGQLESFPIRSLSQDGKAMPYGGGYLATTAEESSLRCILNSRCSEAERDDLQDMGVVGEIGELAGCFLGAFYRGRGGAWLCPPIGLGPHSARVRSRGRLSTYPSALRPHIQRVPSRTSTAFSLFAPRRSLVSCSLRL